MRIGVISDTHGDQTGTLRAVNVLQSLGVEQVLHCGDVGGDEVVKLFADWPTHFVAGNMDPLPELQQAVAAAGQHFHEFLGRLEIEDRRIAVLHGDNGRLMREALDEGFDLVCCGHTHAEDLYRRGDVLVVNPGAIHRTHHPSVAVVELGSLEVTHVPL
jgi:hypothetical protein